MAASGRRPEQTAGRSGRPKMAQRLSSVSCTQRTPAGLPWGMPGIGEEIDGAVQHAPQPARQWSELAGRDMSGRSAELLAQLSVDGVGVRTLAMP